ncbi:MAG: hypothetical protein AABX38_06110 [Candidatus Micrarchaeota archaeon]
MAMSFKGKDSETSNSVEELKREEKKFRLAISDRTTELSHQNISTSDKKLDAFLHENKTQKGETYEQASSRLIQTKQKDSEAFKAITIAVLDGAHFDAKLWESFIKSVEENMRQEEARARKAKDDQQREDVAIKGKKGDDVTKERVSILKSRKANLGEDVEAQKSYAIYRGALARNEKEKEDIFSAAKIAGFSAGALALANSFLDASTLSLRKEAEATALDATFVMQMAQQSIVQHIKDLVESFGVTSKFDLFKKEFIKKQETIETAKRELEEEKAKGNISKKEEKEKKEELSEKEVKLNKEINLRTSDILDNAVYLCALHSVDPIKLSGTVEFKQSVKDYAPVFLAPLTNGVEVKTNSAKSSSFSVSNSSVAVQNATKLVLTASILDQIEEKIMPNELAAARAQLKMA